MGLILRVARLALCLALIVVAWFFVGLVLVEWIGG